MNIKNVALRQIWKDRYRKNGESLLGNFQRVAKFCSNDEEEYNSFVNLMTRGLFFSAGRTMSNAGIGTSLTLNNCFTLNFVEDSIEDIFEKVKIGALTQKNGGGTGYEFSKIRPKGQPTSNDAVASGVISFMDVFNTQTATILQGGRRGANMGILSVYHPDIFDYINAKSWDEGKFVHFNFSVMVDSAFMEAVDNDKVIFLHYPVYDDRGKFITDESLWKVKIPIRARELYDTIIQKAYDNGEPGIFFHDNLNSDNNTYYMETIINTNPCGEYLSGVLFGKYIDSSEYMGACNLGSLFLHRYVKHPFTKDAFFDFDLLENTIPKAVRFLDNIIDKNKYPHSAYENYQKNMRTIGLGITSLADTMVMLNMTYGDEESIRFADKLMNFITICAYKSSIELAKEKGEFHFLDREKFIQSGFIQKHIKREKEEGYFKYSWSDIARDILKYGIRNARLISVAPTGTLSLVYGNNCSSGLEPIISLSYQRKVKIGGQDEDNIQVIDIEDCAYNWWVNFRSPENIVPLEKFVTIKTLGVQEHLNILKAVAFNVDMSCSKTINLPTNYSFEDAKDVYKWCHKNGIKGCTIFRPNPIRKGIFITDTTPQAETTTIKLERGEWKPKASDTVYYQRKVYIGCGKIILMIGYSPREKAIQDMYVIRNGQGGCERNLQTSVIAMSGMLRLGGNIFNIEKALEGVGGCNAFVSARKDNKRLSRGNSCGTAILNEIKTFLNEVEEKKVESAPAPTTPIEIPSVFTKEEKDFIAKYGEVAYAQRFGRCPECNKVIEHTEGCMTCECGFTKCT